MNKLRNWSIVLWVEILVDGAAGVTDGAWKFVALVIGALQRLRPNALCLQLCCVFTFVYEHVEYFVKPATAFPNFSTLI